MTPEETTDQAHTEECPDCSLETFGEDDGVALFDTLMGLCEKVAELEERIAAIERGC